MQMMKGFSFFFEFIASSSLPERKLNMQEIREMRSMKTLRTLSDRGMDGGEK